MLVQFDTGLFVYFFFYLYMNQLHLNELDITLCSCLLLVHLKPMILYEFNAKFQAYKMPHCGSQIVTIIII